jgi:hypothetical protein
MIVVIFWRGEHQDISNSRDTTSPNVRQYSGSARVSERLFLIGVNRPSVHTPSAWLLSFIAIVRWRELLHVTVMVRGPNQKPTLNSSRARYLNLCASV